MKQSPALLTVFLLVGYSANAAATEPVASSTSLSGEQVAKALEARYRDTRDNCGAASKPAFLCTGLLMRATVPSPQSDAWNPSEMSISNGGVSFTYLRSDYKVKRLAYSYDNGFIFYPILGTPVGKLNIEVLCFFPLDGASSARSDGGCGEHPNYPAISRSCEELTPIIDTAEKWVEKYRQDFFSAYNTQSICSFNVKDGQDKAAAARFLEGMRAGRLIFPDAFDTPNDMELKTWAQNIPGQLPIEAFFYTKSTGLAGAQLYQRRFRELTGTTIPIIYIQLPQTLEQSATFTFRAADQAQQRLLAN